MAQSKTKAAVSRRTRGPSIARTTADGKTTRYAVMKAIWSHRGPLKASGVRGLDDGPVQKSVVRTMLESPGDGWGEKASPFVAKKKGEALVLQAA